MQDSIVSPPSSTSPAALIFFGIPELTAHVAIYLRKRALGRLRLVSKALYYALPLNLDITVSPSNLPGSDALEWSLITGRRHVIRSLAVDLDGFQSNPRQTLFLLSLFNHYSGLEPRIGLERLRISYWGGDEEKANDGRERVDAQLPVLESILTTLSTVKEVSVIFMASGGLPRRFIKLLTKVCDPNYGPQGCIRGSSGSLSQLTQLNLEARVSSSQAEQVEWFDFVMALKFLPNLKGLSFTNVSFQQPAEAFLIRDGWYPFVGLKSLKLAHKVLEVARLQELHLLFPMLEELHIVDCQGGYSSALIRSNNEVLPAAPAPMTLLGESSTDAYTGGSVLFPELRTLRIESKYPGNHGRLVDLVKGRPRLNDLEADILPFTRNDVYELAEQCSLPGTGNQFKRLFIHTDMVTDLDEFYEAPCFQKLESVFIQSRQLSTRMFPFASTLKTLQLGGINELLREDEERLLNDILIQLTNLEVLILDRYLSNYNLFRSLGVDPKTSPSSPSGKERVGWTQKRRCLSELSICLIYPGRGSTRLHSGLHSGGGRSINSLSAKAFSAESFSIGYLARAPREIALEAFKRTDKTLDLNQLEEQVLNRFPGLERLTVHLHAEVGGAIEEDVKSLMSRHPHAEVRIVQREGDKK